jgi:hypothetical protein
MTGPTLIEGLLYDRDSGAKLDITEASAGVTHSFVRGFRGSEEVMYGFGHSDDGSLGVEHVRGAQTLPISLRLHFN